MLITVASSLTFHLCIQCYPCAAAFSLTGLRCSGAWDSPPSLVHHQSCHLLCWAPPSEFSVWESTCRLILPPMMLLSRAPAKMAVSAVTLSQSETRRQQHSLGQAFDRVAPGLARPPQQLATCFAATTGVASRQLFGRSPASCGIGATGAARLA